MLLQSQRLVLGHCRVATGCGDRQVGTGRVDAPGAT